MNDDLEKQAKIIIIDIKCHWTVKIGRQKIMLEREREETHQSFLSQVVDFIN